MLRETVGTAWIGACAAAIAASLVCAAPAFAAPPANDAFANAATLTSSLPATATGTNREATLEPGEPGHGDVAGGRSVWYGWTPSSGGRVVVDTCDSGFDTQLSVYTGSAVGGLTRVAGNDDSIGCRNRGAVTFVARAGETYRIAVDGRAGAIGTVRLAIRASGTPANDHIAAAAPLDPSSGAPAVATGSTNGATAEAGEPAHQGSAASRSVWFWWRADAAGLHRIDSCGSSFASRLAVYGGYSGALTSALGNASDCAGGRRGTINVPRPGATYLIALDGTAGATGSFQISVRPPAPGINVVAGPAVPEGDTGQTEAIFTVALDRSPLDPVSVAYEADAPALVDDGSGPFRDWEPASGVLRFAPGELVKQVAVNVNGDIRDEGDESALRLELGTAENATILGRSASMLILDDDGPPPAGWECFNLFCEIPGAGPLRMSRSAENSELVKTIPITRRGTARTVMEIGPKDLGNVERGGVVKASGEVEVSVTCLEAMSQCVGTRYRYSPRVTGKLVLESDGRRDRRIGLSRSRGMQCSQRLPHRNHHCVLVFPPQAERVPTGCSDCRVLLRLSAAHPDARAGNKLVLGADGDHGIEQDKGNLNAVVIENGAPDPRRAVARRRSRNSLPVDRRGGPGEKQVVFSHRLDDISAHEQVLVDATALLRTRHLRYGTFIGAEVVVSDQPGGIKPVEGAVTEKNGFNCTRGPSGHDNPCRVHKVGFFRAKREISGPRYVNLVLQTAARFGGRWHRGDRAKVLSRGGIKVERYGPLGWVKRAVPPE